MEWRERIVTNPAILAGKPSVKGTRISVELVLELLSHGHDVAEILENYPTLKEEDVRACLEYALHVLNQQRNKQRKAMNLPDISADIV